MMVQALFPDFPFVCKGGHSDRFAMKFLVDSACELFADGNSIRCRSHPYIPKIKKRVDVSPQENCIVQAVVVRTLISANMGGFQRVFSVAVRDCTLPRKCVQHILAKLPAPLAARNICPKRLPGLFLINFAGRPGC